MTRLTLRVREVGIADRDAIRSIHCAAFGRDDEALLVDRLIDAGEVIVSLIATHAGPLHALLSVLLGDAERAALRVRFMTASITRFRRENGVWRLTRLNQTAQGAS